MLKALLPVAIFLTMLQPARSFAAAIIRLEQSGDDVLFSATGTLDTGVAPTNKTFTRIVYGSAYGYPFYSLRDADYILAIDVPVTVTGTFNHPALFSSLTAPNGGGDSGFLFNVVEDELNVFGNSHVGNVITLTGSHTFANETLASLGFTANQTQIYTVTATDDTLTLTTSAAGGAIPEPSTICVWSMLLIGAIGMSRRRKS